MKIIIGIILFCLTLARMSFGETDVAVPDQEQGTSNNPKPSRYNEDNMTDYKNFLWLNFHGMMVVGGCAYILMLFTNWAASDYSAFTFEGVEGNDISFWVKIATSWIACGLYVLSIVRPALIKNPEEEQQQQA